MVDGTDFCLRLLLLVLPHPVFPNFWIMPRTKVCGVMAKDATVVTAKPKKGGRAATSSLNSSFGLLDPDTPSPCKICNILVDDGKAIGCNKCDAWVHWKCSELTEPQFNFLNKPNCPDSIKWICPVCEADKDSTPASVRDAKLDTLSALVLTVTQQNQQIIQSMSSSISKSKAVEDDIARNVTEALEDHKERDDRRNNLIFFNVPESGATEDGEGDDIYKVKAVVRHVCQLTEVDEVTSPSIVRLGDIRKPSPDQPNPRPRPIKLVFPESAIRDKVLKNARRLKDSKFKKIGISPDKTKKEREEYEKARKEFRRRKDVLKEDVIMYKGEVFLREDEPWKQSKSAPLVAPVVNQQNDAATV